MYIQNFASTMDLMDENKDSSESLEDFQMKLNESRSFEKLIKEFRYYLYDSINVTDNIYNADQKHTQYDSGNISNDNEISTDDTDHDTDSINDTISWSQIRSTSSDNSNDFESEDSEDDPEISFNPRFQLPGNDNILRPE